MLKKLEKLETEIRAILEETYDDGEIVEAVTPFLSELLQVEGLVPAEYRDPPKDKYGQYLLYKPDDECFSVVAFVWGPGHDSPVHDHLVWGVVGLFEGAVEETRYKRISDTEVELVSTTIAKTGDISHVYPPNRDIHGVKNPFQEKAVTIHIYGTDIGKQPRNMHDITNGKMHPIVTQHRNNKAYYSK